MLKSVERVTGFELPYTPALLATYTGRYVPVPQIGSSESVLMPSTGNPAQGSKSKDWGLRNFTELSRLLSRHFNVVQIGVRADPQLPHSKLRLDNLSVGALTGAFYYSRCAVLLENGLMHFAGHHARPVYCLFTSRTAAQPRNVYYPNQVQLDGTVTPLTPEYVAETVIKRELNRVPVATADTAIAVL
jgi:hypothetical protein